MHDGARQRKQMKRGHRRMAIHVNAHFIRIFGYGVCLEIRAAIIHGSEGEEALGVCGYI